MTRRSGFLHWAFPAMLGLVALTVLLADRDLAQTFLKLQNGQATPQHAAIPWAQRVVSILLVAVAVERVLNHVALRNHVPSPALAWAFVTYWIATVAAPALFGSNPYVSHEYLYTLAIGLAAVLATGHDLDKSLDAARNALFAFLLAGVLMIPVNAPMVLDTSYSQGLLPGVPRLGGLAPHPVALGMVAQTALLCLWCRPFERRWLTRLAWMLGLACLFLAQSKTAWIAFVLCALCMLAVRNGPGLWRRLGDPRQGAFGAVVCVVVILVVASVGGVILVADIEAQAIDFLDSAEGAQLMSMTGRDRIWAVAIEEWHASPLFGYGPTLWDGAYRASIGMPNATNAHNQFMDTLARSGGLGAAALVLYAGVLFAMSVRYARDTGGLSLALFLALALRSISEVPMLLFGYGLELFAHLLLLITLSAAAGSRAQVIVPRAQQAYGVVT